MQHLLNIALDKGAKIYGSISGGKDSQAMIRVLSNNGVKIEALLHCDLGSVEWKESLPMCEKIASEYGLPLHILRRSDGLGLFEQWQKRMIKLKGTGKPFWSSKQNRYCTSDMKRDVSDKFFRNCGNDFIISCEGIRADESNDRAKKNHFEIRTRITSSYYDGMTIEEAIENYTPGKRLAITYYPIFNYSTEEVWSTYEMSSEILAQARVEYNETGVVPAYWSFHNAYVYGNERVSCMFCVLGCISDLRTAAKHNPELLDKMIELEDEGQATFKHNFSLKELRA